MHLKKIKIDYLRIGTGMAPFDGRKYLFHFKSGGCAVGHWEAADEDSSYFYYLGGLRDLILRFSPHPNKVVTHYTPLPEFREEVAEKQSIRKALFANDLVKWSVDGYTWLIEYVSDEAALISRVNNTGNIGGCAGGCLREWVLLSDLTLVKSCH